MENGVFKILTRFRGKFKAYLTKGFDDWMRILLFLFKKYSSNMIVTYFESIGYFKLNSNLKITESKMDER